MPAAFPEVADIGGLTARMVEIDHINDALKRAKKNGWQSTLESPAHLALRLNEQFREAARLPDAAARPESFRKWRDEAEHAAADLETALRAGDTATANRAFDRAAALCTACHREYRDRRPTP